MNISATPEHFWEHNSLKLIQSQTHNTSNMFLEAFTHAATHDTVALILSVQCVHIALSAARDIVTLILSMQCVFVALSAVCDTVSLILSMQCVHITLSLLSHQAQPTNSAWNTSD